MKEKERLDNILKRIEELSFIHNVMDLNEKEAAEFMLKHKDDFEEWRCLKKEKEILIWINMDNIQKNEERNLKILGLEKYNDEGLNDSKILYCKNYIELLDLVEQIINGANFLNDDAKAFFLDFFSKLNAEKFKGL